ncbi:hypothetical protein J7K41_01460, partial [Candidatus Micrarchaeota archaeon]|nr:hypothetical protein [Candidatus Micrarchaeota archaeon]
LSAALVGLFMSLITSTDTVALSLLPPVEGATGSVSYLTTLFSHTLTTVDTVTAKLVECSHILHYIASIKVNLNVVEVKPFNSLDNLGSLLDGQVKIFNGIRMLTSAEILFLEFVETTTLTVFLPVGLALRAFFMTRKIGGALLAIGLGFYLVYPLVMLTGTSFVTIDDASTEELNDNIDDFVNDYKDVALFPDLNNEGAVIDMVNAISEGGSKGYIVERTYQLINDVSSFAADLIFFLVILPLLSLVITVYSIYELSRVFGGEIIASSFDYL